MMESLSNRELYNLRQTCQGTRTLVDLKRGDIQQVIQLIGNSPCSPGNLPPLQAEGVPSHQIWCHDRCRPLVRQVLNERSFQRQTNLVLNFEEEFQRQNDKMTGKYRYQVLQI